MPIIPKMKLIPPIVAYIAGKSSLASMTLTLIDLFVIVGEVILLAIALSFWD